ncbi:alpha/beta hydrolase [Hymenobacter guriensis]|uniref:Alpha/beta hydrolase n=1 Tax=Hymenobacter guriensis TaxID=2793065 RepID=A0ABS0KW73_9BACT|nr:alpha/beta fold hydrolase [Hymenobacter guriensis]MBG8552106.1 alpha/beta hydrolase [Hymenobacter guriensis]
MPDQSRARAGRLVNAGGKVRRRRIWLLAALLAFIGLNAVAFFHAWRFTHFSLEAGPRTGHPERLTGWRKLGVLLTGVVNPKPVNRSKPAFPYQTVLLRSPNGHLETWYAPVQGARGTVALFHGYTSSKAAQLTEAAYFRQLGYSVLLTDFAGNGGSEGNRCTVGYREAEDVRTVFRWLQRQQPEQHIVLYGVSMGAEAILRAESELGVRPAASIVECPYGSMLQTARNRFTALRVPAFPLANLLVFWGGVQNGFWAFDLDATEFASRISTPTLLMWGEADPRVTRAETDAIFQNLRGPKQRQDFADSGHEPYWGKHPALWQRRIREFLQPATRP